MAVFGKSLAGAGYVVLNVIRAMNIIGLLAVIAASAVMLVKTFNNNSFFFFDAAENVIRVVMCGFLILTELPLFKSYFARNWPLFSPSSGFVMLGCAMLLVGNGVLANLNKESASQEQIGLAFWRLVISSGIVVIVMGSINLFASYIFRDTKRLLTARQVRSHGAVASHKVDVESSRAYGSGPSSPSKPSRRSRYRSFFLATAGSGTGASKRTSLPSYHAHPYMSETDTKVPTPSISQTSPSTSKGSPSYFPNGAQSPGAASSKYSVDSPIGRPDLAHHPAMTSHRI